jgi:DNA-binding transcriptional LysR family regulator
MVRQEELIWATSARHSIHESPVLPIAVAPGGCCWRKIMTDALDTINRPYRVAYASPNASTINITVQQGLAVAVMPEICMRPGMRILSEAEGFPKLGTFDIGLIFKPGRKSPAVEALTRHVKEGLQSSRFAIAAE